MLFPARPYLRLLGAALGLGLLPPSFAADVRVAQEAGGRWRLWREGRPFDLRGVGGYDHLEAAVASGANTIRTWGIEQLERTVDGKTLADRAHRLGLAIVAGVWLRHEYGKPSYDDPAFLDAQRAEVRAAIRRHRSHPAILVWGLGNEMEGPASRAHEPRIWRELEVLARIVKEEDPGRPIVTVLAGAEVEKIRAFREHCPSIDILGLNSYGPAPLVTQVLDEAGWTRPFLLTEFGPRGPWESTRTAWGAPLEPRLVEKAALYVAAHRAALSDPRQRCLGTFCFKWGQKQELTDTWFGMFLHSGEKTELVDVMAYEFTGRWPANRSPRITSLRAPLALDRVPAGKEFSVSATTSDPDHDSLTFEWMVRSEIKNHRGGGGPQEPPPSHPECIVRTEGSTAVIRTPREPGAYRLFLYVRDQHGSGTTENIPFWVNAAP